MRDFIVEIAEYARSRDPDFLVIPQNGEELISRTGSPDGPLAYPYFDVISGQGREDLFFGYDGDGMPTPRADSAWMSAFLDRVLAGGKLVLVTDYVSSPRQVSRSYQMNGAAGYASFAAPVRELDVVPDSALNQFLYLINPHRFDSPAEFVDRLAGTDYPLLILDPVVAGERMTGSQVQALQQHPDGSSRTVLAYLSIGEAEEYRAYWSPSWKVSPPSFLGPENSEWPGNYTVRYWDERWKSLIFGSADSALDQVISAGFSGVYLDIVDAYERFE
jgi:cysteinyl-tRNA synthetase